MLIFESLVYRMVKTAFNKSCFSLPLPDSASALGFVFFQRQFQRLRRERLSFGVAGEVCERLGGVGRSCDEDYTRRGPRRRSEYAAGRNQSESVGLSQFRHAFGELVNWV